ncbi:MAG: hypothetical protein COA43_09550 [Robiginitomaculum sp.]|nr:MAG: hypothetical protein COA43_09550 [Robiginitomaculum sp.]
MTAEELFFHHMLDRMQEFKNAKYRYVHYTSASVLLSILEKKEIWLRHTTLMNDYQEIERGIQAVTGYFGPKQEKSTPFWEALDECFEGVSNEIKSRYDFSLSDLRNNTFVMSFSAHRDSEDNIGRLSMWRAYAPKDGIALVLHPSVFYREENKLNVFSYPALYWSDIEIQRRFSQTVDLFINNKEYISTLDFNTVVELVLEMLVSFALCLKHPGFAEELEMRIVYRPNHRASSTIVESVEIIGTTPQIIHKIPLTTNMNTDLNSILDRVILGPSRSIVEVSDAILHVMNKVGIPDAAKKIFLSDIPLRT